MLLKEERPKPKGRGRGLTNERAKDTRKGLRVGGSRAE
jgi:hypothetical protein